MTEFDRADPDFVEAVLEQVYDVGGEPVGLSIDFAPNSFDELAAEVELYRDEKCDVSNEIDRKMELIASDTDPDEVVRMLPYDTLQPPGVWFVLPSQETINKSALKGE